MGSTLIITKPSIVIEINRVLKFDCHFDLTKDVSAPDSTISRLFGLEIYTNISLLFPKKELEKLYKMLKTS